MRALLKVVIWIAVIFGAITAILLQTCMRFWIVPGDDALLNLSIMPTLEAGDRLLLWRGGSPGFGDLVRCTDPETPARFVIGRMLGEQGDKIVADQGTVTVNDKLVASRRACAPAKLTVTDPNTGEPFELACDIEQAGGVEFTRARADTPLAHPPPPYRLKIPDGQVFLASDDRYYHDDSRDFGPVSRDSCREVIMYRFWSARGWFDVKRRMMFVD